MTSRLEDFTTMQQCAPHMVAGICADAVGHGTVNVTVRNNAGGTVAVALQHVLYVPELYNRAGGKYARLFSVARATSAGHQCTFGKECATLKLVGAAGAGVDIVQLVHKDGLVWMCAPPAGVQQLAAAFPATVPPSKQLWHLRLGHLGNTAMGQLVAGDHAPSGVHYKAGDQLDFCSTCALCKSRVHNIPKASTSPDPQQPFELVGLDFNGPMSVASIGGARYSLAMVCFKVRYIVHDVVRTKDEAPAAMRRMVDMVRLLGYTVKRVRVDNDSVLLGEPFRGVLRELVIVLERTAPYAHWQHARIERQWDTLVPMALCMVKQAGLGLEYWSAAMHTAVYIRNRVPSAGAGGVPYKLVTGAAPDMTHMRVFGCPAYVHVDKSRRHKLDDKAWRGVFVGYALDSKAWLVYNPKTRQVVRSRNVVFDEAAVMAPASNIMGEMAPAGAGDDEDDDDGAGVGGDGAGEDSAGGAGTPAGEDNTTVDTQAGGAGAGSEEAGGAGAGDAGRRYPQRERRPPQDYWLVPAANAAHAPAAAEPISYKQAMRSPDHHKWKAAMDEEMDSQVSRQVWKLVPKPAGRKVVDCKWVYRIKRNADGSVARFKARLVARGFTQERGVDYTETFAPTVRIAAIRLLLALAAHHDWEVEQMDVKTAFLEAHLEETIYMRQPEGYREVDQHGTELVCVLQRALYGLKQAPRNWNATITQWLVEYGFKQSAVDPGVFVHTGAGGVGVYVLVLYVDDNLLMGPAGDFIPAFKKAFKERFEIQDLGPVAWMLGMTVERDRTSRTISLGQQQYVLDMLERFNMLECKPVTTPMVLGALSNEEAGAGAGEVPYASLVGSLQYAAVTTRPDIAMPVSHLCRYMAKPTAKHWEQAKRVLRYLQGTQHHRLVYGGNAGGAQQQLVELVGYCDSDWASDVESRRSRSGYVFMMHGGAVSWRSMRQATVALSTAEAEYMALAVAVQEALFLRQLVEEVAPAGVQAGAMTIKEDNQACIALVNNTMTTGRTKHIDVRYHFCRERVESGDIKVEYCSTDKMLADVLTKPLAAPQHHKLCGVMMGHTSG